LNFKSIEKLNTLEKVILYNTRNGFYLRSLLIDKIPIEYDITTNTIDSLLDNNYLIEKDDFCRCASDLNLLEIDNLFSEGDFLNSSKLTKISSLKAREHFRTPFLNPFFKRSDSIYISENNLESLRTELAFKVIKTSFSLIKNLHTRIDSISWTVDQYYYTNEDEKRHATFGISINKLIEVLFSTRGKAAFNIVIQITDYKLGHWRKVQYEYEGRISQYPEKTKTDTKGNTIRYSKFTEMDTLRQRILVNFFPINYEFVIGFDKISNLIDINPAELYDQALPEISSINLKNVIGFSTDISNPLYLVNLGKEVVFGRHNRYFLPKIVICKYDERHYWINSQQNQDAELFLTGNLWAYINQNSEFQVRQDKQFLDIPYFLSLHLERREDWE